MPATESERRLAARLKVVDEHIMRENQHDLESILQTFGRTARYDDEPWDAHYIGHNGVRTYYDSLLKAMPDLRIEVQRRYASNEAVVVEVIIVGHHLGAWRGLPPTGRAVRFPPLCGIFAFDDDDRLAGEKSYYDRATVMRQLGIFHEPDRLLGRIAMLMHPLTVARMMWRMVLMRRRA